MSDETDFDRVEPKKQEVFRIVVFFDDIFIDEMGESLGVEAHVKNYNCLQKFKVEVKDMFYPFNSR